MLDILANNYWSKNTEISNSNLNWHTKHHSSNMTDQERISLYREFWGETYLFLMSHLITHGSNSQSIWLTGIILISVYCLCVFSYWYIYRYLFLYLKHKLSITCTCHKLVTLCLSHSTSWVFALLTYISYHVCIICWCPGHNHRGIYHLGS